MSVNPSNHAMRMIDQSKYEMNYNSLNYLNQIDAGSFETFWRRQNVLFCCCNALLQLT